MKKSTPEIIVSPIDPSIGYSPGLGEFAIYMTPEKREEIEEFKDAGFTPREIDEFVSELAKEQLLGFKSRQNLIRAEGNLDSARSFLTTNESKGSEISRAGTNSSQKKLKIFNPWERKRQKGDKPLQDWESVHIDGAEFKPEDYALSSDDNRRVLYLSTSKRASKKRGIAESIRVSYELKNGGKEAMFEGMKLPVALRGRGLGPELFKYFTDGLREKGIQLTGTSCIRKPGIAKILQEAGFIPESEATMAVILPRIVSSQVEKIDDSPTGSRRVINEAEEPPVRVQIISGEEATLDAIRQSISPNGKHIFYEVVTTAEAKEALSQLSPEEELEYIKKHTIPLNTRWVTPKNK